MTQPGKGKVGVGGGSRAGRDGSELDGSEVDSDEVGDDEIERKVQNLPKSKKMVRLDFLTPGAKLVFAKLRQAFGKLQSSTTLIWNVISRLRRMH